MTPFAVHTTNFGLPMTSPQHSSNCTLRTLEEVRLLRVIYVQTMVRHIRWEKLNTNNKGRGKLKVMA
jgi:hypothetical protein